MGDETIPSPPVETISTEPDNVVDVVTDEPFKDIQTVAEEVLAGHWGRGRTRDDRLRVKGYDVDEVNKKIFEILNLNKKK